MNFEKAIQDLIVFSEKKDSLAFDLFFNETKDLIYRVAFHYMRCDAEAEDILQSVFLKIFTYAQEKPQSIKEIKNLKSWLIQITLNASKMLIRSKIRQREKNMKKLTVPNESTDENREQLELVKKYLIELPEKYRLPVCLHYVENMSFSEISSVLKIDQPTIKVQVSRGLEKLRNLLQKAGFTISTSAFSAMLIESSFQKTPSSLTFIPTSKTMGASLDQVIGYSENSAWHAFTLKNILFITFVLLFTGGMMMLFMKKESLMKEGKLITEEPISTFSYNFEKKVPNGIQVASTEKTIIEPNKGLIIPEGNNATTITYEGINFNDQPYIIVNEIFTSKFSSLIQSMYGVNNKKYFWSPASTLSCKFLDSI
jgi:RNA polymerase sigma-70 factor (ECF subfamily)